MKLTIDFDKKEVKVLENVKLHELVDVLKKTFPDNKWKEFILDTSVTVNWNSYPVYHYYPYYTPASPYIGFSTITNSDVTCTTDTATVNPSTLSTGTYNFDVSNN